MKPNPHGITPEQIRQVATEYKVSLRTARRHLYAGTLPSQDRRFGSDGKTYPAGTGWKMRSRVAKDLALCGQALQRAHRKACEDGYDPDEHQTLLEIQRQLNEVVEMWTR
ncbi:MAG: hypothetical protein WCO56_26580 [Verrucomicrobiota bacterium]